MAVHQMRLLYDGDCPFCRREVEWLKRRDLGDHLVFENIAAIGFDPGRYGLTHEEIMGSLHGILPDGRIVRGGEAIREAYRGVGLGWLVAPTRLPIISGLLDGAYRVFARNRVRLGRLFGRDCRSGTCPVSTTQGGRRTKLKTP
jgi:predicted DCC family thiol-disulfide oxidoreductase YuxK